MLDRMRAENGNPHFGWTLERTILDLELADLESALAVQAASEQTLTPPRSDGTTVRI